MQKNSSNNRETRKITKISANLRDVRHELRVAEALVVARVGDERASPYEQVGELVGREARLSEIKVLIPN